MLDRGQRATWRGPRSSAACGRSSAAFPSTGRRGWRWLEADVAAACEGLKLLAGGADELVVHGQSRRQPDQRDGRSLSAAQRPARAMECFRRSLARGGRDVPGRLPRPRRCRRLPLAHVRARFAPPTRRRADLWRATGAAWTVGAPLLGIVGNDRHLDTLGSLAGDAVPRRAALARARRDDARVRRSGLQASTRSAALR